jgi:predicted nucleotidyltransferase
MHVRQQKKLSNSVKVRFVNAPEIIEVLKSISGHILQRDENVLGIYLFGSLSDDTYVPGSDADILIVLKDDERRFIDRIPEFLRYFLTASVATDVFPYTRKEAEEMISKGNSFFTNIWDKKKILAERTSVVNRVNA